MLPVLYHTSTKEYLAEIKYISARWLFYMNEILDCLQSRKYCDTIVDDLLSFTQTRKTCMAKLDLWKS